MFKENPEIPSNVGNMLQLIKAFVRGVPIEDEEWKDAQIKALEGIDEILKVEKFDFVGPGRVGCRGTVLERYIEVGREVKK